MSRAIENKLLFPRPNCTQGLFQRAQSYICDDFGNVTCLTGWKEPADPTHHNPLNPCPEPICNHHGEDCFHGECVAPNLCACEIGWKGSHCQECLTLACCQNGYCEDALECKCQPGWTGSCCDCGKRQ